MSIQISHRRYHGILDSVPDFERRVLGRRIQIIGHSAITLARLSSFQSVSRSSRACPANPGSVKKTHPELLAAVMCDAEVPCSVNTAYEPESSFRTCGPHRV